MTHSIADVIALLEGEAPLLDHYRRTAIDMLRVIEALATPPALDVEALAGEVVALLTTTGRTPPPLNDYGLLSLLFYYAGPNARTAVDAETARRVTRLSDVTTALRDALAARLTDTAPETK